jgi:hypothetical protein
VTFDGWGFNVRFTPKSGHLVTTFFVLCNALFLQRSSLWINAVARAFLISTEGGELCSGSLFSTLKLYLKGKGVRVRAHAR